MKKDDDEFKIDLASDPSKCLFEHEEYDGAIFLPAKNSSDNDNTNSLDLDS